MSAHPWPHPSVIKRNQQDPPWNGRRWSCFNFSTCQHEVQTSFDSADGNWHIALCTHCGRVNSKCNHREFEWNDEGTLLRCTTCGLDGT